MGVTFIAKEGTYTAPAKLTTKSITENGTYNATDDSANGYSSVTVNVEGGGGSSDFSTATVTVVGNEQNQVIIDGAVAQTFPSGSPITAGTTFSFNTTAVVVLYKGEAVIQINNPSGRTINVSGSVQNMGATAYIVTGDCTITIS